MDVVKELSELKTAFRGYDKEAVHSLIKELLKEWEKEKEDHMSELLQQNQILQTELQDARDRLQESRKQTNTLFKNMSSISEAIEKETEYARERDRELEGFKKKEEELKTLLDHTREEAMKERSGILEQAEKEREEILSRAEAQARTEIENALQEKESILKEAKKNYDRICEQSDQVKKWLEETKNRFLPLFSGIDEKKGSGDHENV